MTISNQHTPTTVDSPLSSSQLPPDSVGVDVEDFGLEFYSLDGPEKRFVPTPSQASRQQIESTPTAVIGNPPGSPFEDGATQFRDALDSFLSDSLPSRLCLASWKKLKVIAGIRTSPASETSSLGQIPDQLMDWANLCWITSGGLLIVSVLGGYWGYSWFDGVLLFFLAYLVGRGFSQIIEVLSRIEADLSTFTRGTNKHD